MASAWDLFGTMDEPDPPTAGDLFFEAKLLAQRSSHHPLGWGEAHRLMQLSADAGRLQAREQMLEATDRTWVQHGR